ncbi:MAG TPA: hypothetical protein EYN91_06670 [Candidatus Melainabacteria bacterium]|nr:MAG: hypothetical protein DKT66_28385 [Candidatus Melainabacteria bacterium]HIA51759.1 hypothetical protein [Candidatus Melainabacteria bacterium]
MDKKDRLILSIQIAQLLDDHIEEADLPSECDRFGLNSGDVADADSSKRMYVRNRLDKLSDFDFLNMTIQIEKCYPDFGIRESARKHLDAVSGPNISDLSRRLIIDELEHVDLFGDYTKLDEDLETMWPISELNSPYPRGGSLKKSIIQHCIRNPGDWDNTFLLDQLDIIGCSRTLFFEFLEKVVHPNSRRKEKQQNLVDAINQHLKNDGYHFIQTSSISGYPIFKIVAVGGGVAGAPKNLIFAADGPKPEIVLSDAINNDIRIVKNADNCLVYDRPIGSNGLSKQDMLDWWKDLKGIEKTDEARKNLVERLSKSLASIGERNLFYCYYKMFKARGDHFPALVPQVYLHYDPYTIKQLGGFSRLARQRMDFLILFSSSVRVVIEVDGSQHFSDAGIASLKLYAEMVEADRDLKLAGYEIYRFGANELCGKESEKKIQEFFSRLVKKHGV